MDNYLIKDNLKIKGLGGIFENNLPLLKVIFCLF